MTDSEFTLDELIELDLLSDAQISPGGESVAFVRSEFGGPKGANSRPAQIWMTRLDDGQSWKITSAGPRNYSPRWNPDGSQLAFLSERAKPGTSQIYCTGESLQEPRQLTDSEAGVIEFSWSPDGSTIAFTMVDHQPETDNDVRLFDASRRFSRLYLLDVSTTGVRPLPHGDLQIWEHCWAPDGRRIAAIVSDSPEDWSWYKSRLVSIDVNSGDVDVLFEPERQIARPAWSPDGETIAVVSCRWSDPGMTGGDVLLINVPDRSVRNLTEGEPRSHLQVFWTADSESLLSIGLEYAKAQVCRISSFGGSTPLWSGAGGIPDYGASISSDRRHLATVLSTPQLHGSVSAFALSERDMDSEIALRENLTGESHVLPRMSHEWLAWKSTDGREIQGLLIKPAPGSGSPWPMVTIVHGGPTGVSTAGWNIAGAWGWIPLLLERGFAVFLPNYRGSNGYGVEFAEANIGDLGGLDLKDVLTGVEHCVQTGLADPARLGIGGWSYGGYITPLAVCESQRFAAAVSGASITNWFSFHGGTNIPGFDRQFIGASAHELDGPYAWQSPLFSADRVQAPILFIHGEADPCCPVGQAYEMTRALRSRGAIVECAIYPREQHGFVEREHLRDMINRAVGWFSAHLGQGE